CESNDGYERSGNLTARRSTQEESIPLRLGLQKAVGDDAAVFSLLDQQSHIDQPSSNLIERLGCAI
ncbi:hypothetical protein, partial [Hydrogenimonas sp.]